MSKIGAQLYTLREYLKTPVDIAKTLQRVKKMGYHAVQVSAVGPIETTELAKILREEGLACAATHVSLDMMKDTQRCVDYHHELKCRYTAIGGFSPPVYTVAEWQNFATAFTEVAKKLAGYDVHVGYHNHSHELAHVEGRPALDILLQSCGPEVWFEIDTYWITHGGGDPAAWIEKVAASGASVEPAANRLPCVHLKDMIITEKREQKMCEVGGGNLNWARILPACEAADVQWYLVERDSGDLDPFESLRLSLMNLQAMGLR